MRSDSQTIACDRNEWPKHDLSFQIVPSNLQIQHMEEVSLPPCDSSVEVENDTPTTSSPVVSQPLHSDIQSSQLAGNQRLPKVQNVQPRTNGWKSPFLRAYILATLSLITAAGVIPVAMLMKISQRDGALQFRPTKGSFSLLVTFSYEYLPTVIAVLLTIPWDWVNQSIEA